MCSEFSTIMSVFGDFQQVWSQRFPHSDLPDAWEEDIRANLQKHNLKVANLKEELKKEEIYVQYLERLLADIEENKKKNEGDKTKREATPDNAGEHTESLSKNTEENEVPSAPPYEQTVDSEANSVNKCISELSANIKEPAATPTVEKDVDPSTFVTVIEVNGVKANEVSSPVKSPPKPPAKPVPKARTLKTTNSSDRASSVESLRSSTEQLEEAIDEPFYDEVAADEARMIKSISSSTENVFTSSSTLPIGAKAQQFQIQEPQSPDAVSNYVNIEYFIQKRVGNRDAGSSSDEEELPELRRSTDEGSYASSSSLDSSTPSTRRKFSQGEPVAKFDSGERNMFKCILNTIIDSETNYVDWLNVLRQYMRAIKATVGTSQPVLSEEEYETIFYKIPELYSLHLQFLDSLKRYSQKWEGKIGDSFKYMAKNLDLYGAFLSNYGRAVDTVRKCSEANLQFAEVTKNITCKQLSGQPISLEELLHKPVARMQKNALVLHDLLKYTPKTHPDYNSLYEALFLTQSFLDQFNMIQTKSMFPVTDRAQRRLVKNSFIVELVDGARKLRHLFLFNDVVACAKYKSCNRNDKYTFQLKWFIPVEHIYILEESTANPHEVSSSSIVSLKSQASNVRDQLRQEANSEDKKVRLGRGGCEKFKKRLMELESQLVLVSPNLVFRLKHGQTQKTYTFFLSSDFERTQWVEAIQTLQKTSKPPAPNQTFTMFELQTWITACRSFLKTNMGSYLLRSHHDESLLIGDLHLTVHDLSGLEFNADLYVCVEVDFYGHFFRKAKTNMVCNNTNPVWNESFVIDLEGCENLRILVYRENAAHPTLFGKHTQKLSRNWLTQNTVEKRLNINGCVLKVSLKFIPYEVTLRRVPTGKAGALFGEKIQQVCKRQKRDVPFIITACIREVERRGMSEVGVYRVSGSASDLAKLKKSFETNSYEAEQLLKEVDIHSVTGILKLYLRELPEALFTDQLYPTLLEAFNQSNNNLGRRTELLKECFTKLPQQNKSTIQTILEHLIRVNNHENENKMSLHNLATVFGPTLLRPGGKIDMNKQKDMALGTVDVMAQAGILYCFLQDMNKNYKEC